jgi:hypothetical protein
MEKKQTAVEWLMNKIFPYVDWYNSEAREEYRRAFDQAKKMEKEQMIEFAKGFWYYGNGADAPPCYNEDVEKYYNKIYGKQTDRS